MTWFCCFSKHSKIIPINNTCDCSVHYFYGNCKCNK